jgi:putative ABC transport system permease protein
MNLARKDIRHNLGRFALTTARHRHAADDRDGHGGHLPRPDRRCDPAGRADRRRPVGRATRHARPVRRSIAGSQDLVYRVTLAVPGVGRPASSSSTRSSASTRGKPLRMSVLGLSWPLDKGEWLPLIAGRRWRQNHFEMIADKTLGLRLHERITLGKETYTVVGITSGHGQFGRRRDGLCHGLGRAGHPVRYGGRSGAPGARGAGRGGSDGRPVFLKQPALVEQLARPAGELPAIAAPI